MHSNEEKVKLRTLKIAAVAIFSVVFVELTIGLTVNSLAIVSDGLHALLDALTSVLLFLAVRAALKPPDEEHTYGHEKFEAIGGLAGGIILIVVACIIFYEAGFRILNSAEVSVSNNFLGFVAIAYALFIASLRIIVFKQSHHIQSQSMKAGFYDAIGDMGSTVIALAGFALALFGFSGADGFASIFLASILTYLSLKLTKASVMELSDSASKELLSKTRRIILSCVGVVKVENLKVRKVGAKIFVDATVQVPSAMSLDQAHLLASKIESCLKDAFSNLDATIHVEPSDQDKEVQQKIQKIAMLEGASEVHEITINYVEGKRYITLHAHLNSNLSVEEAHRIAEKIEKKICTDIKPLENVTVHIEPAELVIPIKDFDETKLQFVIKDVAGNIDAGLQISRIVTYASEGKRYINIDCCMTKDVVLKDAHRLASRVEKETKDHFFNAIVTVHIEPQRRMKH